MNYYRVTAYDKFNNFSIIVDCHGKFEQLFEFSTYVANHGFQILSVSKKEKWLDVNIEPIPVMPKSVYIRAISYGRPEHSTQEIDGVTYDAIKVGEKIYVPNNN